MATRAKRSAPKEETVTSADRPHYGRVYRSGMAPKAFRGVIWHGNKGSILHDTAFLETPDAAYDEMKAHAEGMGEPVQLWRHGPNGNVIADLVGDSLPF